MVMIEVRLLLRKVHSKFEFPHSALTQKNIFSLITLLPRTFVPLDRESKERRDSTTSSSPGASDCCPWRKDISILSDVRGLPSR